MRSDIRREDRLSGFACMNRSSSGLFAPRTRGETKYVRLLQITAKGRDGTRTHKMHLSVDRQSLGAQSIFDDVGVLSPITTRRTFLAVEAATASSSRVYSLVVLKVAYVKARAPHRPPPGSASPLWVHLHALR